jgi:Ca-activated chloride channel family protein
VHTIGFKVGTAARRQLACIASATGGTYREASSGAALGAELTSRVKRAIRPYQAVGTPIRGGDSPATAPQIRPGQYLDTYARGGDSPAEDGTIKFYAVDLQPGDTPYFSATLAPPGIRVERLTALTVSVRLVDQEGDSCAGPASSADVGVYGKVVPQTAVLDPGPVGESDGTADCVGRAYLRVTRRSDAFADQALPMEIAFRLEPAVSSPGPPAFEQRSAALPAPAPGASRAAEAGSSFNDAPLLEPGTYTDSMTTGETRYYRVRLGWGQRLAWRATVTAPAGVGAVAATVRVDLASPLRVDLRQPGSSESGVLSADREVEMHGSTLVPVRYANRRSRIADIEPYSVDGDYFLVLDASYPLGGDPPFALPLRLTVQRSGAAEPGPEYVRNPSPQAPAPASGSPSPARSGDEPVAGSASTRRMSADAWLWAGGGTAAVVLAAVGALLWLRRAGGGPRRGGPAPPG